MWVLGAGFNNINKNIGNLQEMFQNNTYRNYNPNLYNVGRFGTNGINKNHSIGSVLTHSFIKEANSRQNNRLSVNYNKSGTDGYITDVSLQNRTTLANPQFIREEGIQNNRNDRHEFGVNYLKTNSYNDNLSLNGTASSNNERGNSSRFTEVRDSANTLQSTNNTTSQQNTQSDNESLTGTFAKADLENPLKSVNIQFGASRSNRTSERDVRTVFQSFTDASKSNTFNRTYLTNNNSINIGGTLDYTGFKRMLLGRYNLFGIDLRLSQRLNYTKTSDNSQVGDYDSTSKTYDVNGNLSNQNKREIFEYTPGLTLSKNFYKSVGKKYRSINAQVKFLNDFKTDKNSSSFAKRNLDRSFQFFRYEGNISYSLQKQQKFYSYFTASYTKNFDYPSIDQLYTIVDNINVYNIRIGNAFLRNRIDHRINFSASFNTQNPTSLYSINGNFNGGYTRSLNSVSDSVINDFSGQRRHYYINADKSNSSNLNSNFNISRRLKKSNLQLMYSGQFRTTKLPNYIDSRYNISETDNLSNQLTLQFSLRSLLVVNLGHSLQRYKTEQNCCRVNLI
jgi:hypothetical protein